MVRLGSLFRSKSRSETQEVDEAREGFTQAFALFGLEFAHQRFFQLCPIVGETIAQTRAAIGQDNARLQVRPDSLTRDNIAIDQSLQARLQHIERYAKIIGNAGLGRAFFAESEQDGVISRFEAFFMEGNDQRLVGELTGLDEFIQR
jgi:hypothetical protein